MVGPWPPHFKFAVLIISDDATRKLEDQEMQQQVNHDELLTDLAFIREKAKEVWEKIGIKCSRIIYVSYSPIERKFVGDFDLKKHTIES